MSEDEREQLEEIRRRKMLELQQQAAAQAQQKEAQDKFEAQKDAVMRKILSSEARQRLQNLKLVRPEVTDAIEGQLIQLVQMGQINRLGVPLPMSDEHFKLLLQQLMNKNQKKDFTIKRQ
ncbi:MAG: DNA-binding protein [Candidatus Lokiarchaeota archaeon]|nr:DNA-binding protein [Candidatus Lokiarchaeota archaeon]